MTNNAPEYDPKFLETTKELCRELYKQIGRDAMLRQNDPVETLFKFALAIFEEGLTEGRSFDFADCASFIYDPATGFFHADDGVEGMRFVLDDGPSTLQRRHDELVRVVEGAFEKLIDHTLSCESRLDELLGLGCDAGSGCSVAVCDAQQALAAWKAVG